MKGKLGLCLLFAILATLLLSSHVESRAFKLMDSYEDNSADYEPPRLSPDRLERIKQLSPNFKTSDHNIFKIVETRDECDGDGSLQTIAGVLVCVKKSAPRPPRTKTRRPG